MPELATQEEIFLWCLVRITNVGEVVGIVVRVEVRFMEVVCIIDEAVMPYHRDEIKNVETKNKTMGNVDMERSQQGVQNEDLHVILS